MLRASAQRTPIPFFLAIAGLAMPIMICSCQKKTEHPTFSQSKDSSGAPPASTPPSGPLEAAATKASVGEPKTGTAAPADAAPPAAQADSSSATKPAQTATSDQMNTGALQIGVVTASVLNRRERPGMNGRKDGYLYCGETVLINKLSGDWFSLETHDSALGWASRSHIIRCSKGSKIELLCLSQKDKGTEEKTIEVDCSAAHESQIPAKFFWSPPEPPPPPFDECPNLPGNQKVVPPGMIKDQAGLCAPKPVDACPNIAGLQESVPPGKIKDKQGNCVDEKPHRPDVADQCPNLTGVQASVPPGKLKNKQGDCVDEVPAVDVCPNISGVQAAIPEGLIKDKDGNCTTKEITPEPFKRKLSAGPEVVFLSYPRSALISEEPVWFPHRHHQNLSEKVSDMHCEACHHCLQSGKRLEANECKDPNPTKKCRECHTSESRVTNKDAFHAACTQCHAIKNVSIAPRKTKGECDKCHNAEKAKSKGLK